MDRSQSSCEADRNSKVRSLAPPEYTVVGGPVNLAAIYCWIPGWYHVIPTLDGMMPQRDGTRIE